MAGGRAVLVLVAAALLLGACSASKSGSSGPASTSGSAGPAGEGSPSGPADASGKCGSPQQTVEIAAAKSVFDKKCLAAKAGQPIKVKFDNTDNFGHNFAILDKQGGAQKLFTGEVITGPMTTVYQVPVLPAGTYFFQCNIHPFIMQGSFVVS